MQVPAGLTSSAGHSKPSDIWSASACGFRTSAAFPREEAGEMFCELLAVYALKAGGRCDDGCAILVRPRS